MATRSECEREAREAAANLVLSTALPHSVRMGTRVLETLGDMREILSYHSIGCKQALPIFEELVKAGQEPAGEDYPATNLEHRLVEWLDRREAAPDTPPAKPQSPRQPIFLNLKRKASEASEESEPEKPEPEVTTFLLPRAAEPREEDFMRNKAAPVFHSSNHVLVPCEFRHTGPGVPEAELLECLYSVGDDKYQGKGCAWMAWRLVGQAQPPDVGHHVVLRPERGANLWVFFHKPTMKLLPHPPASTQLYKLGKGKLHDVVKLMANCLEQKGTMRAMSRGEYDGLVAANEPPAPEFSPRRVLKNYGDMTTSEFQSHLIKLDTTFRGDKALNTGKRPPNSEDEFVHLQSRALLQLRKQLQDDQLQTESLLVSRHRQLLMTDFVINESTVNCWWYNPEVHQKQPLDFFEAYGRARDERRTLIFYGDSGKGKTPLASCLAAMVARDVGLDEFVMVSSPDMLRSAVERSLLRDERPLLLDELQISSSNIGAQGGGVDTLKHLLGLSPDLPATIKMSLQRREGACGDVQDHHGAGPGETPPQLGRHGKDLPSGPHARRV